MISPRDELVKELERRDTERWRKTQLEPYNERMRVVVHYYANVWRVISKNGATVIQRRENTRREDWEDVAENDVSVPPLALRAFKENAA